MMRRGITRGGHSNLPVPKASRGSPGNSKSLGRGGNFAHSAEDIPQRVQNSYGTPSPHRRAVSPGDQKRGLSVHGEQGKELENRRLIVHREQGRELKNRRSSVHREQGKELEKRG
jgi:hypothetical protein